MAWANVNNTYELYDMDSSDGTNAKRLRVRNTTPNPPAQTHRVEILERAEPLTPHNALKINGDTEFDYYENSADHLAGHITVEPAGLFISADSIPETDVGDPNLTLGWANVTEEELLVGNSVFINGKQAAIGPNQSTADGFALAITKRVGVFGSSTSGEGELSVEGRIVARNLDARLEQTEDHALGIGTLNATVIDVAKTGVQTAIAGSLHVAQTAEVHGLVTASGGLDVASGITMHGGTLDTIGAPIHSGDITSGGAISAGGAITAGSTIHAGSDVTAERVIAAAGLLSGGSLNIGHELTVVASISSDGNINATGTISADGTITSKTGLSVAEALEVNGDEVSSGVPTSVKQDGDASSLVVESLSATTTLPALHVTANDENHSGVGILVEAATAINTVGDVEVGGDLRASGTFAVNGATTHGSTLDMQAHNLIMGGTGGNQVIIRFANNRCEFLVGGTLRFYIDTTGGHNA